LAILLRSALPAALLAGVVYLARTGGTGFVSDDFPAVAWASRGGLRAAARDFVTPYLGESEQFYRPLASLSYRLDFALFGAWPAAFHLTSVLLHLLNSGLLAAVVTRLPGVRPGAGRLAGALFALGPLHPESVVWIASRSVLLCACFSLTAAALLLRGLARGRFSWGSLLAAGAALASKEDAVALPPLLLLLAAAAGGSAGRAFRAAGPHLLLLPAYFAWRGAVLGHAIPSSLPAAVQAGGAALAGLLPSLGRKLDLLAAAVSREAVGPVAAGALRIALLGAAGAACLAGLARRRRTLAVAAGALGVALLPTLFFEASPRDLQNARLLYLPALVFAGALGHLLTGWPGARIVAAVAVAASAAALTANLGPWRRAAARAGELRTGLSRFLAAEGGPALPVLFLDAPDQLEGAQVFRNGLAQAFEPPFRGERVPLLGVTTTVARVLAESGELRRKFRDGHVFARWDGAVRAVTVPAEALRLPAPLAEGRREHAGPLATGGLAAVRLRFRAPFPPARARVTWDSPAGAGSLDLPCDAVPADEGAEALLPLVLSDAWLHAGLATRIAVEPPDGCELTTLEFLAALPALSALEPEEAATLDSSSREVLFAIGAEPPSPFYRLCLLYQDRLLAALPVARGALRETIRGGERVLLIQGRLPVQRLRDQRLLGRTFFWIVEGTTRPDDPMATRSRTPLRSVRIR
jgi:hypothetical protein